MTTGPRIKETVSVYVVTPLTFAGVHTVYMLLLVIILVNGKRQWERALALAVNIYSEQHAFANSILPSISYSVEMPNVINKYEL